MTTPWWLRAVPPKGRETLRKYLYLLRNRELDLLAGYLAFTTLLSLIPLLALVVAFAKWWGNQHQQFLDTLVAAAQIFVPDAAGKVRDQVVMVLQSVRIKRLGVTGLGSLVVLLFLKMRMIRQSFRSVIGAPRATPVLKEFVVFLVIMALLPVAFTLFDQILDFWKSPWLGRLRAAKITLWFVFIYLLMELFMPLRVRLSRRLVFAAFGGGFLFGSSLVFSNAMVVIGQTGKLYGVFASVPIFLIWIFMFWRTVTLCIVFCCEPFLHVGTDGKVTVIQS